VPAEISTSYVERQNLSVRMSSRRFTRLTNAFSKKLENHAAAVSLYVTHYNMCRVHEDLRTTPAVALGIADRVWSIGDLLDAALATLPVERDGNVATLLSLSSGSGHGRRFSALPRSARVDGIWKAILFLAKLRNYSGQAPRGPGLREVPPC
jgi:hypothetical protein